MSTLHNKGNLNLLTLEDIHKLPVTLGYNDQPQRCYSANVDGLSFTFTYELFCDINKSNGLVRGFYNVSVEAETPNRHFHEVTEWFTVSDKVSINNLSTVPLGELEAIITMLQSEVRWRM